MYFQRISVVRPRPPRDWNYLPPHVCKYCGQRFYNDVVRYLFHKRQHEKWIRPYWYKYKSAQNRFTKYIKSKRPQTDFPPHFSSERTKHGNDSVVMDGVQVFSTYWPKVLLDKTKYLNSNTHQDESGNKICPSSVMTRQTRHEMKYEKPYQCKYCNKSFSWPYDKTRHERIHTKEKPYQCKNCNKSFSQLGHKTTHERIHTKEKPYQCKYCNKCFSIAGNKNNHERIHTKEKPYQCKYCNKSFSDSSHKTQHERIHTKEKSYQCK